MEGKQFQNEQPPRGDEGRYQGDEGRYQPDGQDNIFVGASSSCGLSTKEGVTNFVRETSGFQRRGAFQWGLEGRIRIHHVKGRKLFSEERVPCMKTEAIKKSLLSLMEFNKNGGDR